MINLDSLRPVLSDALQGDLEAREIIKVALTPEKTDSVDEIAQKIRIYISIFFGASKTFDDADYHREIDHTYAEQIHSYLNNGAPRYTMMLIIGFRESAKTTRVLMNQTYVTVYLKDLLDYVNVLSESADSAGKTVMDVFNMLAISNIGRWYDVINPDETKDSNKKKSKRRDYFTTTTEVTYAASGVRSSLRGGKQVDVDESGDIEVKRPKVNIFDDIENETTVESIVKTEAIRGVLNAAIDGQDQMVGFTALLGNYLSLRGNVHYFLEKYRDDDKAKVINIPIYGKTKIITWPGKYCMTDAEQLQLASQGTNRVSIESLERRSDNFEVEFLNNPRRARVYFNDDVLRHIDEDKLVPEKERDATGLLILEEPTGHDQYIFGIDTATGVGKDESAFVVWKTTGLIYEEVANFRSNSIPPEKFAPYTANLATRYNNAKLFPERNFPGNEFIALVKQVYNNIFIEEDELPGIHTNVKTKPEMFVNLKKHLNEGLLKVRSQCLYRQLMEYPADEIDSRPKRDEGGGHYDVVMAAALGIFRVSKAQQVDDSRIQDQITRINSDIFGGGGDSAWG